MADLFVPGFAGGGPARALTNLVAHLHPEFEFWVLTRDRDLDAKAAYSGVKRNVWLQKGGCQVRHASPWQWSVPGWLHLLRSTEYDLLYLPSFFSRSAIAALVFRRAGLLPPAAVIVAPQGQFHAATIAIKVGRKRAYLRFCRRARLLSGVLIHATNRREEQEARSLTGAATHLAPCLATPGDPPVRPSTKPKRPGRAAFVCVARIHPVKNLHFALACLAHLEGEVSYDLFGPIEDKSYWRRCQTLISGLPKNVRVRYRGHLAPEAVHATLCAYEFFFLPTTSENHGHAILEAMAAGLPPVISDRTPWRNLPEAQLGWDLPLHERQGFVKALQQCLDMTPGEYRPMAERAITFCRQRANDPALVAMSRELFRTAHRMREGDQRG